MQFSPAMALSEAFAILRQRLGALIVVALIFYALMIGATFLLGAGMMSTMAAGMQSPEAMSGGFGVMTILFYIVFYAIQFAQQLALTRLCSDRHEAGIGEAISAGFSGVPTMLGAALLLAVAGIAAAVPLTLLFAAVAMGTQAPAVMITLVLVIAVAGLYLLARLCLLNPVVAIDEVRNPITVIARSWSLTAGHVLGLVLVYGGALLLAVAFVAVAFVATLGVPGPGNPPSGPGMAVFVLVMVAFALAFSLFMVTLVVAIHRQLAGSSRSAATAFE